MYSPTLEGISPETQQGICVNLSIRDFVNLGSVSQKCRTIFQSTLVAIAERLKIDDTENALYYLILARLGLSAHDLERATEVLPHCRQFTKAHANAQETLRFLVQASYSDLFMLFFCPQYHAQHHCFPAESLEKVSAFLLQRKKPTLENLDKMKRFLDENYPPDSLSVRREIRIHCLKLQQFEALRLLIDRREESSKHYHDSCPVFDMLMKEDREGAIRLVQNGANLNQNTFGRSLLHGAIQRKDLEFFKILIEQGAFINSKNTPMDETPLKELMIYGIGVTDPIEKKNLYTYLVENGADIDAENVDRETPLLFCLERDNFPLFQLFLDLGADPNKKDADGQTPLHKAAEYRKLHYVEALLAKGADLDVKDKKNKPPAALAGAMGRKKIVTYLVHAKLAKNTPPTYLSLNILIHNYHLNHESAQAGDQIKENP